jgi:hypothetical protein
LREVVELIETHFAELIDMFVIDLYNYLSNDDESNYLVDLVPNYAQIAAILIENKSNEFCNVVRKSSYGENEFKRKLYLHYKCNRKDRQAVINLYTVFNIVTEELLDMLGRLDDDDEASLIRIHAKHLTQVLDRDVIDTLFELIDLTTSENQLCNFLDILKCLVQIDAISLLEVHQRISLIKNISCEDDVKRSNSERIIYHLLSNLSCFEVIFEKFQNLPTETGIDEEI